MHTVFLRVVLSLTVLLFGNKTRNEDYSIRKMISKCNDRLLAIKVPDIISRPPKKLDDINKWKASELRSWLFFYSLPVLNGVLPLIYFKHYAQLVFAVYLLSQSSITREELEYAKEMLQNFYSKYEDLYGLKNVTMCVHLLGHLPSYVSFWGPLWTFSAFPFESMNRHLKHLFHGNRDMSHNLATSFSMLQSLPVLLQTTNYQNSRFRRKSGSTFLGRPSKHNTLSNSITIFLQSHGYEDSKIYERFFTGSEVYYSKSYRRQLKRNSTVI